MRTKISALIDGELDERELREVCIALRHDEELRRACGAYVLIGDTLRREPHLASEFAGAVLDHLADEPVVLAPRGWAMPRPARREWPRSLLAMAATLAGVAVVAWLGLTQQPAPPQLALQNAKAPATSVVMASADGDLQDYLIAHQIQSGSGFLNSEAQQIRTVSLNGAESGR